MIKQSTPVFELHMPKGFDVLAESKIAVKTHNNQMPFDAQPPVIDAAIFEISELNSLAYVGDTLEEKFEDWCLSYHYKSEKLAFEEIVFKGFKTFILHSHTDAVWSDTHFKIRYFQACIFLDDHYFLEFKALHEKLPIDSLDAWVMPVFESIEVVGDAAFRKKIWTEYTLEQKRTDSAFEDKRAEQCLVVEDEANQKVYDAQIPTDGGEIFKVGAFEFEWVLEDCSMQIPAFSGQLVTTLKAMAKQPDAALNAKLLDDYPGDGEVSISIEAKGIHQNGVPTGTLTFQEGKTNAPLFLYARIEGFDYRLDFNGCAHFESGWIVLAGEMTKRYHDLSFPIFVAKKFDVNALSWQDYRFTSLQETQTINAKQVRFLHLENTTFTQLPKAMFSFENLEALTLSTRSNSWENTCIPLNEISSAIGQLSKLKNLNINGALLESLPDSIGKLKNLEQLSIDNCLLKELPNGVWQLPALEHLWLSHNQLTHIPDDINLPVLKNIHLDNNQLKTLPEALAKLPKLKTINLTGNPLEHLPDTFNQIESVELSIEDKLRLLDFDYKGADGKGLVEWDDTVFWAQYDADLAPSIKTVIADNKLETHGAALLSMVKKSIGFTHEGEEDYADLGNHRFGGMPDLPLTIDYPRFGDNWRDDKNDFIYEFIGQINCSDIAHLQDYLPRCGMLFFFLETIHSVYDGEDSPCQVIYCEDNATLCSGKRFAFVEDDYSEMDGSEYQPYKANAAKINSAPSFYASYANKHLFVGEAESLKENEHLLETLYDAFETPLSDMSSFSYAVNAYGFSQHEQPELQASLRQRGNPQDWIILLTVTSSGDMQWGDSGDLFFVIHKSDLACGDFSNVFVTMESS